MSAPSSRAAGRSTGCPTEPPAHVGPIRHSFGRLRMEPHSEQPHLPGPSIYPVGFAIGVACLLVGIIVSWVVAAVGAGIGIVFAFLWVRDVAGRRGLTEVAEAEPEVPGPLAEPGFQPEPAERFPRSIFLESATLGIGGLIGGIVTVPALGFMVLPAFVSQG